MSIIKTYDNFSNSFYEYKVSTISSSSDAVDWIYNVVCSGIINAKGIFLDDLTNKSYDSTSVQILPPFKKEVLIEAFQNGVIDMISITGNFEDKPIVIGFDFKGFHAFITIRKSQPANYNLLAEKLCLLD